MSCRALLLSCITLLSCPAAAGPKGAGAKADPKAQRAERAERRAQELTVQGDVALKKGRYALALRFYQQAHDQRPSPSLQYRLGECHRGMGNAGRAAFAYRQYLKYAGEVENRREVEELAARMERLASETRAGLVPEEEAPGEQAPAAEAKP